MNLLKLIKTKKAIEEGVIPVDIVVSPERLITNHIQALIETPGSLQVLEFGDGLLHLVGVRAVSGGPLINHEIGDLKKHMPNVDTRVAAIFRGKGAIIPQGNTTVLAGDEVIVKITPYNLKQGIIIKRNNPNKQNQNS